MKLETYLELKFRVEFDYHPSEPQTKDDPGCDEWVELTEIKLDDPLIYSSSEIVPYLTHGDEKNVKAMNVLFEHLELECLKSVHEQREDPR